MTVTVRLFAALRTGRFKEGRLELTEGSVVRDVLQHLDIPRETVGILLVNGTRPEPGRRLVQGDVVAVFPALGGG